MMSLVALSLAAAYLFRKKYDVQQALDERVAEFQEAAAPANPGPTSKAIRSVQARVHDELEHLNLQDLDMKDVRAIKGAEAQAAAEVTAYECPPTCPEIQGVYLSYERGGF